MFLCVRVYLISDLDEVPRPHRTRDTPTWGASDKVKAGKVRFGLDYHYEVCLLGRFPGGRQVEIAEVAA
jgi:hypothetical protein